MERYLRVVIINPDDPVPFNEGTKRIVSAEEIREFNGLAVGKVIGYKV